MRVKKTPPPRLARTITVRRKPGHPTRALLTFAGRTDEHIYGRLSNPTTRALEEKLAVLREADAIFREEMALAGLNRTTSQYFAVLTSVRSVGVMGDERTYDYTLALRAVQSQDFMTATWSRLPYELLDKVSGRIVGEVKHINRIVYDITSKPPATVEWE